MRAAARAERDGIRVRPGASASARGLACPRHIQRRMVDTGTRLRSPRRSSDIGAHACSSLRVREIAEIDGKPAPCSSPPEPERELRAWAAAIPFRLGEGSAFEAARALGGVPLMGVPRRTSSATAWRWCSLRLDAVRGPWSRMSRPYGSLLDLEDNAACATQERVGARVYKRTGLRTVARVAGAMGRCPTPGGGSPTSSSRRPARRRSTGTPIGRRTTPIPVAGTSNDVRW